jgi:hypothetical protein
MNQQTERTHIRICGLDTGWWMILSKFIVLHLAEVKADIKEVYADFDRVIIKASSEQQAKFN